MKLKTSFWQRLRRTPYQAIASISMIYVTLFVVSFFLLLVVGSSAVLTYFESKPQLTVFFKNDKDKASVDELINRLKSSQKIANAEYVSKEQALAIYKEQNKDDPLLLEMVTADILPASLDISATSPKYLAELETMLKNESGIEDVVFQKDVVDTLISWTSNLRKIGLIFIIFLLLSTFFILLTSMGMKIALRKEEIEILRLVGATPWYIKRPIVYEGITYGIVGATLSWITVIGAILYMSPFITAFFKGIPELILFSYNNIVLRIWPADIILFASLLLILVTTGIVIGLVGSLLATSRYMKN